MYPPPLREIRSRYNAEARKRSYLKGTGLFVLMCSLSAAGYLAVVLSPNILLKLPACIVYSIIFSAFFAIGHDACHGSLTPSFRLNQWIGRIAFLPTLHPYVCWELGHNHLHHRWTNLKGMDYGYPPFTLEEFRSLSRWRQILERAFRTPVGIALFYAVEIWWKHLIWPRGSDFQKLNRRTYVMDTGLVFLFLIAETTFAAWIGYSQSAWSGVVVNVSIGVLLPFAIWNWIMAFVTVQHHTHPRVAWFNSKEEWTFFFGQIEGTVHVKLPRWIELLYHNIFEHTAHHADPKIPLYNLRQPQRALELAYPGGVTVQQTSLAQLRRTLKACKLYDYRRHCWLDFDGNPTSKPILVPKQCERNQWHNEVALSAK
jgi:acyl-lipid omega-6 desaturase (Delta-12 desaturase)